MHYDRSLEDVPNSDVHDNDPDMSIFSDFYCKHREKVKYAHLNINSGRHKFDMLANALKKGFIDILSLQETKLDGSFPVVQFHVDNFKLYRKGLTTKWGGLMMLLRGDIPHRRLVDLEVSDCTVGRIEVMVMEVILRAEKSTSNRVLQSVISYMLWKTC